TSGTTSAPGTGCGANLGARASRPRRGNQPPNWLCFPAAGALLAPPWGEINQKLALFFGHFWIKWLILNHIVALFPLEFALFSRFSRARRQSSLPDEPTFVPDTLLPIRPSGLPIRR